VVETNEQAVEGANLVTVCVPVGICGAVAKEIAPHLKPGAIISNIGSVKGSIVRDMGPHLPKSVHFVPVHPVAGTEHSGPDAGFVELFENRWCILTPHPTLRPVEKLAAFWRLLDANVERMTPDHHDLALAITSHLPHLSPTPSWAPPTSSSPTRMGVLEMLGRFNEDIAALTKAIRKGDGAALHEHFTRTRAMRRGIIEAGQYACAEFRPPPRVRGLM
jgi:cyclohexadieny/prephenate dehydrogenase